VADGDIYPLLQQKVNQRTPIAPDARDYVQERLVYGPPHPLCVAVVNDNYSFPPTTIRIWQ
jgi:hypothetical protein